MTDTIQATITPTEEAEAFIGTMFIMDASGHKDFMRWGESEQSQAAARVAFEKYKRDGYAMFVMTDEDEKGRKLESFDPGVRGFIAIAPLRGG